MGAQEHQAAVEALTEQTASLDEVATETEEVSQDDIIIQEEDGIEVIETEETPAVDAPNSWSKEDKEHFSTLPQDAQVRIANRERDRDLNIRKTQDEVAEERKAIEASNESVKELKAQLAERLKGKSKKPSVDMLDTNSESYDPDAYHLQNAKYEKNQVEAKSLEDELSLEDAKTLKTWQENEIKTYKEVLPEFIDADTGQTYRQELANYAVQELGITMEDAATIFPKTPAKEMLMMAKAMKWDAAVARTKAAKTKPKAKTLSGGNSNPSKPVVSDFKGAAARFNKDRSPEAAAALLSLNKKG